MRRVRGICTEYRKDTAPRIPSRVLLRGPGDEKNGAFFKRVLCMQKRHGCVPYSAEFSQSIKLTAIKSQVPFIIPRRDPAKRNT